MNRYQHVMYASKGTVEQVYSELYGDVDQVTLERGTNVAGSIGGKLGQFLAKITGEFSGELTESEIKEINFDDEMFKAKKLANDILDDDRIPNVSSISGNDLKTNQLYRFSCEVTTEPFESEIDDQTYIQVSGEQNGIIFSGDTSVDNWGLRSHIVQSVRAAKRGETYPYQGLMWPLTKTNEQQNTSEYDVNYLLICGPRRKSMADWFDQTTEGFPD